MARRKSRPKRSKEIKTVADLYGERDFDDYDLDDDDEELEERPSSNFWPGFFTGAGVALFVIMKFGG